MDTPVTLKLERTLAAYARAATFFVFTVGGLLASSTMVVPAQTSGESRHAAILQKHASADRKPIRIREDLARQRLWVLTVADVNVYDTRKLTLIRRIELPRWSVADFDYLCPPDLTLDSRGGAFVSNNVEPRLFEVEPITFTTKEHTVELVSRRRADVGFAALAFRSDGALLGMSAAGGSLFRIDLAAGKATEIAVLKPAFGQCTISDLARIQP